MCISIFIHVMHLLCMLIFSICTTRGDLKSTLSSKATTNNASKATYQRAFDIHTRDPLSGNCKVFTRYYLVRRVHPTGKYAGYIGKILIWV